MLPASGRRTILTEMCCRPIERRASEYRRPPGGDLLHQSHPDQCAGPTGTSGAVSVQVIHNGVPGNTVTATATQNAPGCSAIREARKAYPAAVFPSGAVIGDPAVVAGTQKTRPGDRIALYATGLAPSTVGNIIYAPVAVPDTVTVTIGSATASVEYAGLVAVGEFQINIVVPSLPDGEYPIVLRIAGASSQAGVMVPITH